MAERAYLVLEDGSIFEGRAFGAPVAATGEVVFNTSMTGYQEALTDPSYAGQMLVMTYPIQGNYGTNAPRRRVVPRAGQRLRRARDCEAPSERLSTATLHEYLRRRGVPGLCEVDTRALTRRLRVAGVMMGALTQDDPQLAVERLRDSTRYGSVDLVPTVSAQAPFEWPPGGVYAPPEEPAQHRVVVLDMGVKHNVMRSLRRYGCEVTAVPARSTAETILDAAPGRRRALARPRRPGAARLRRRYGEGPHRARADPGHLPGPPGHGPGPRRADVQAAVRPPRREPPGEGRRDGARAHHVAEPRLRGRRRRPAGRRRGQPRPPQRRHGARACAAATTRC